MILKVVKSLKEKKLIAARGDQFTNFKERWATFHCTDFDLANYPVLEKKKVEMFRVAQTLLQTLRIDRGRENEWGTIARFELS